MDFTLFKRPSAFMPVAMSIAALATAFGYAAMLDTARQADEGTAAHAWQRYAPQAVASPTPMHVERGL
jgi:hypothetical protein